MIDKTMLEAKDEIIRRKDLAKLLHCDVSTIDKWVLKGKLPKPLKFGNRFAYWLRKDIDEIFSLSKSAEHSNGN